MSRQAYSASPLRRRLATTGVSSVGTCSITCPSNTNYRASRTRCAGSPTAPTSTIGSASHGPLGEIGNAVHYLVGNPVEETFDDFVALGRALRENGRFPIVRASLQVAGLRLLQWQAAPQALVSPEVVPFRPHRGVLLIVEEPIHEQPRPRLRSDGYISNTIQRCSRHPALPAYGHSVRRRPGTTPTGDGAPNRSTSPSSTSTRSLSPPPRPWLPLSKNGGDQLQCDRFSPDRCGP